MRNHSKGHRAWKRGLAALPRRAQYMLTSCSWRYRKRAKGQAHHDVPVFLLCIVISWTVTL